MTALSAPALALTDGAQARAWIGQLQSMLAKAELRLAPAFEADPAAAVELTDLLGGVAACALGLVAVLSDTRVEDTGDFVVDAAQAFQDAESGRQAILACWPTV